MQTNTSSILERIEAHSEWVKKDARSVADFVALLPARRDYPTLAEDAMDRAEKELVEALRLVRRCRATFNAKPVEQSHAVA